MTHIAKEAAGLFDQGYNCAQAVLLACGCGMGLPGEIGARLAQGLGGGIGRTGYVCGALTGALMAMGLRCPLNDPRDQESRRCVRRLGEAIVTRFRERHGSILCRDLLGFDLSTPEGHRLAHETGRMQAVCPGLVADAAAIFKEALRLG